MEHLSKQQIVLLTLFVSFVTSIATGIVAVSLMDQAPAGVTQTITNVVEKTIERVVSVPTPSGVTNTATVANTPPTVQDIVGKVSKGMVRLKVKDSLADSVVGIGLVLSKEGVIVTDKTNATTTNLFAVFSDGKEFPLQVLQSQILGDVIFLTAIAPRDYTFTAVTSSTDDTSIKLGETVLAIGGTDATTLEQGFVSKSRTHREDPIETSISSGKNIVAGSPLINLSGEVIGIKTNTLLQGNSFYPLTSLKALTPIISR